MNDLLALTGGEIPFLEAKVNIYQPKLRQIGYIGQDNFFLGCQTLTFSKDKLVFEDKVDSSNINNFDIFMTITKDKNPSSHKSVQCVQMLLTVLFPSYDVRILPNAIALIKDGEMNQINAANYDNFQKLLIWMFCLKDIFGEGALQDYKPANKLAQKIANKLKERHKKLRQLKKQDNEGISILSRYMSILAVGEKKDLNSLREYTIFQLFDEFQRFGLKQASDMYVSAKLSGAQDIKEPENWMKDIHSNSKQEDR